MIKHQIEILYALSIVLTFTVTAPAFEEFAVDSSDWIQEHPDVDDGRIVWQEYVEFEGAWDWDIYGVDLLDGAAPVPIYVAAFSDNQKNPAIWNNYVVWQDDELSHWDIWLTGILDPANPKAYHLSPFENDQIHPAIHGSTVVWQDEYTIGDWDIYAADITDPNNVLVYAVDNLSNNQITPNVHRSTIVYQDNYYLHWDVISAEVWVKNTPEYQTVISDEDGLKLNQAAPVVWGDIVVYEHKATAGDVDIYARDMSKPSSEPFLIAGGVGLQQAPDISGHIVVWEDNRNGNFDIYGYNLIIRQEFQITTDGANQTNPAISGTLVVWEDLRDAPVKPMQIYVTWLGGDVIADCLNKLAGDVDGNCRVNLVDFMLLAEGWLVCGLEPETACGL